MQNTAGAGCFVSRKTQKAVRGRLGAPSSSEVPVDQLLFGVFFACLSDPATGPQEGSMRSDLKEKGSKPEGILGGEGQQGTTNLGMWPGVVSPESGTASEGEKHFSPAGYVEGATLISSSAGEQRDWKKGGVCLSLRGSGWEMCPRPPSRACTSSLVTDLPLAEDLTCWDVGALEA